MKMYFVVGILAVVCLSFFPAESQARNAFDIINGCRKYVGNRGYNEPLDYFPTSSWANVGHTSNSRYFRIAILGTNDGHIRFGESAFPYNKDTIEIVLSGWLNTKSVGRRQYRNAANAFKNEHLGEAQTPNLLSPFRPTMFKVEVFNHGLVEVSVDGQQHAFLKFSDIHRIRPNYMAFTKYDRDLIFFYDCPLSNAN